MTREYERAENGNVALAGEVDLIHTENSFILSLGFGYDATEAGHHAWASIMDGFNYAKMRYVQEWKNWQNLLSYKNELKMILENCRL